MDASEPVRTAIRVLADHGALTSAQAEGVADALLAGVATPAQVAAILFGLRLKGETVDEIAGFARAMRRGAVAIPVDADALVDPVGTGGDGLNTFNISTTAAFVAAAAGCRVAKHGNRAISSRCGSADVLRELGVCVDAPPERTARCIRELGIGFLYAPLYHPGMRALMGPRTELGVRTIFNMIGPLTNPAGARRHVIGIYDRRWTHRIAEVLGRLGSTHALVVHGEDGLDEISLSGRTTVSELRDGKVETYSITPEEFGLARAGLDAIGGADPTQNATTLSSVLSGEIGPRRDIVLLNAAATIYVAGVAATLGDGVARAAAAIDSGAAMEKLRALVRASAEDAA